MELIEISNNVKDYLYITYNFTTTCNFKCNYCWPTAHDGKYRFPDIDIISKNFSHLLSQYNKKNVRISLSGGEPTLWPELGQFVKYLHDNHAVRVTLNTNGSRTLRWWKEYADYFDDIQISIHNEFVDIEHTKKVLDEIYSRQTIMTAASVLMDPNNWDRSVKNVSSLVEHPTPWLVKLMTLTKPETGEIMDYSEDQLLFLKNKIQKRPPEKYIELMFDTGKIIEDDTVNGTVKFSDGTIQILNIHDILKNKANQFKGWYCNIGKERLGISPSGLLSGNCGERIFKNHFNLHDPNFVENFSLKEIEVGTVCSKNFCDCSSDIRVSKRIKNVI